MYFSPVLLAAPVRSPASRCRPQRSAGHAAWPVTGTGVQPRPARSPGPGIQMTAGVTSIGGPFSHRLIAYIKWLVYLAPFKDRSNVDHEVFFKMQVAILNHPDIKH